MKFTEVFSDELASCYAVCRLTYGESDYVMVASEVEAACYAYDLNNDFAKTVVWQTIGGTMSIVQVPDSDEFLATQKFYPGFQAEECRIVHGKYQGHQWDITEVIRFPYLHRFDLIPQSDGTILFIGCTIANSKQSIDDWSDPGKVFVGEYDKEKSKLVHLRELPLRLTKNHGYFPQKTKGYSLITAVEGVFKVSYPAAGEQDWEVEQLFSEETSDIVQLELAAEQPQLSNVVIQGFHGDVLRVLDATFSTESYRYPTTTPFGHALWAGTLSNSKKAGFLFGWREAAGELRFFEQREGKLVSHLIDSQVYASNVIGFTKQDVSYVFAANNGIDRVTLYRVVED